MLVHRYLPYVKNWGQQSKVPDRNAGGRERGGGVNRPINSPTARERGREAVLVVRVYTHQ